ncbi:MAG: Omp28-related outer membrane protein [Bacteroidota bacterium]|nr:Omp28-related outer membrane protein [Bacteroidota bacterium]
MKIKVVPFLIFLFLICITVNSQVVRNPVLEYCTGTWCQYCPCGHTIIENQLIPAYPNAIFIGYHGPVGYGDPWSGFPGNNISTLLGFNSYPTGVVDRVSAPLNRTGWFNAIASRVNDSSWVDFTISKTYKDSARVLDFTVNFTALKELTGTYLYSLILMENKLIHSQTGNSGCVGGTSYSHDHVVRAMINGALGDTVISGTWANNQIVSKSLTYSVPSDFVSRNCELVVLIYKKDIQLNISEIEQANKYSLEGNISDVEHSRSIQISGYELMQNYPNPFNPNTVLSYKIANPGMVTLKVYDLLGKEIVTLVNEYKSQGEYSVNFDGSKFASGVYIYKLTAGAFSAQKKMTIIK